jgi:phosphoribosylformylglycinamidine synthase
MVGLNDDENRVLPSAFQEEGSQILLLGETKGEFGGSLYVKALHGETSGIAIALSKMAAVSNKGIVAQVSVAQSRDIFDETQSRALIEVSTENLEAVVRMAIDLGVKVTNLGQVGGETVKVNDVELPLEKVKEIYFTTFARTIEQDL